MDFNIGDVAIADKQFVVKIVNIEEENGVKWYECKPLEFDSINRFFEANKLDKVWRKVK